MKPCGCTDSKTPTPKTVRELLIQKRMDASQKANRPKSLTEQLKQQDKEGK